MEISIPEQPNARAAESYIAIAAVSRREKEWKLGIIFIGASSWQRD
jgi:hypothetical protein